MSHTCNCYPGREGRIEAERELLTWAGVLAQCAIDGVTPDPGAVDRYRRAVIALQDAYAGVTHD